MFLLSECSLMLGKSLLFLHSFFCLHFAEWANRINEWARNSSKLRLEGDQFFLVFWFVHLFNCVLILLEDPNSNSSKFWLCLNIGELVSENELKSRLVIDLQKWISFSCSSEKQTLKSFLSHIPFGSQIRFLSETFFQVSCKCVF